MKVIRTALLASRALKRNLMRAVLTTIGIMIGIAAVIAMVEIGQGSRQAVERTISSMGANNLLILPGTASSGGVSFGAGSVMTLTPQDAEALERECSALSSVAPIVRARAQVVFGNKNWVPNQILGTTPDYLAVRDWLNMTEGEMFGERDVRNASKVCVIGRTLVRELFDGHSPIGKEIRIQNVSLRVVGVLGPKGANMMGMDQDDIVLAPWTTIKTRISGISPSSSNSNVNQQSASNSKFYPNINSALYPGVSSSQSSDTPSPTKFTNIDQIITSAKSAKEVDLAISQITEVLRERHRIRAGEPEDFNVRDMTEMVKAMTKASGLMTTLLLVVAMISLVVGGVGIMNIMLVSVTERTREIGLRMAVGARGRDILQQFLVEAVVLCLVGGIIGIVLGRVCSLAVSSFLQWPTHSSIGAIAAAVFVSATVGVAFGFYPAWKASKMDPIEALRYE